MEGGTRASFEKMEKKQILDLFFFSFFFGGENGDIYLPHKIRRDIICPTSGVSD
jgi:hypothetical protein